MSKKLILTLVITLIIICVMLFLYKFKKQDFPKIANIISSEIIYSDYKSYVMSPDGKCIYTNTFEKIDIVTGENLIYPQVFANFKNAINTFDLSVNFSTFSLSPDGRYLIMANVTEKTITEEKLKYVEMGKVFDLESQKFEYVPDDLNIYSWNPNDSSLFLSNYGVVKFNESIDELEFNSNLNGWENQDFSSSSIKGNGVALWDISNNIPIVMIQESENKYYLISSDSTEYEKNNFPKELIEQYSEKETNILFEFDQSGQYIIFVKLNSNLDSSIWLMDWKTMETKELFRMSDYDKELPIITNVIWSTDGSRVLVERKNSNFLILEISYSK